MRLNNTKVFLAIIQIALMFVFIFSNVSATALNDKINSDVIKLENNSNIKNSNQNIEDSNNGYIIEFNDDPAFISIEDKSQLLTKESIKNKIESIKKQHQDFKVLLLKQLFNEDNITLLKYENKELPIIGEYYTAYNGIALNVSKDDAEKLAKLPNVKKIIPNQIYHLNLDTTIDWLRVSDVWNKDSSTGNGKLTGKGVVVAVIDSGAEINHPMFGNDNNPVFKKCTSFQNCAKVLDAWDFVSNNPNPYDDNGHGTHTASTVAGIADGVLKGGVAPDAKLLIYKVCDSSGGCSESAIVSAIERSLDPNSDGDYTDHADIISMSLGGSGNPDCPSCKAINNAADKGVISIVSAGNSGPSSNTVGCPACAEKAIAVAAGCKPGETNSQCAHGAIADFSSRGPTIYRGVDYKKPEITAPGVMICAAKASVFKSSKYPDCFDSSHVRLSGTSMAAPHMAGIAALIVQNNPGIKWNDFEKLIQSTATNIAGFSYNDEGAGMINPVKIFNLGDSGGNPPVNNTNSTNPIPPTEPPTTNSTNSTNPIPPPVTNSTNSTNPLPPPPSRDRPEDVNKDGVVDNKDLIIVLQVYGNRCSSPNWCYGSDINHDGIVDINDVMAVARVRGK